MSEVVTILIRLGTLVVLMVLVMVAMVADALLLLPMLFLGGPLGACTSIAVDAAAAAVMRLLGFEGDAE
jgi:hypothetical protein